MFIKQLEQPLFFETPKGKAICHFLIDYGIENDLFWVCFNINDGECWTWPNSKIRITKNISIDRINNSKITHD